MKKIILILVLLVPCLLLCGLLVLLPTMCLAGSPQDFFTGLPLKDPVKGKDIAPASVTTGAVTITSLNDTYIEIDSNDSFPSAIKGDTGISVVDGELWRSNTSGYAPAYPLFYQNGFTEAVTGTSMQLTETFSGAWWKFTHAPHGSFPGVPQVTVQHDDSDRSVMRVTTRQFYSGIAGANYSSDIIAFNAPETKIAYIPSLPITVTYLLRFDPIGNTMAYNAEGIGIIGSSPVGGVVDGIIVGISRATDTGVASDLSITISNNDEDKIKDFAGVSLSDKYHNLTIGINKTWYKVLLDGVELLGENAGWLDNAEAEMVLRDPALWTHDGKLGISMFSGLAAGETNIATNGFNIDEILYVQTPATDTD